MADVDGLRSSDSDSGARRRERNRRTAELLNLEAGRIGVPVLDGEAIAALLRATRRIAIVGASPDPVRASHGVLQDLLDLGYQCIPVNPHATQVAGLTCFPTLRAAVDETGPVDIVDVFRLPSACPAHAREAVEVAAKCLWLQLGIASAEAGRIAHDADLAVVMNRCLAVEARRYAA